jgi:hypothetical protein
MIAGKTSFAKCSTNAFVVSMTFLHYRTAVAASAIIGLLVYGAVKHADFIMALGQSVDLSTGCGDL